MSFSLEESEYVAAAAAQRLNQYRGKGRVKVVIPLKGFSSISVEGGPLCDPAADKIFADTLKKHLDPAIEMIEVDSDINSPRFARAIADALMKALKGIR